MDNTAYCPEESSCDALLQAFTAQRLALRQQLAAANGKSL